MPLKAVFYSWDLNESCRKLAFKCPHCEETLIPVIPQELIIKHFRHKSGEFHGEPETPEHVAGKKLIYDTLQCLGVAPSIESRIGERVADIFVKGRFIIEFQYSDISVKELAERTNDYLGISDIHKVLWIFGGQHLENAMDKRRWERDGNSYLIQKIKKAEQFILEESEQAGLYYCDGKSFFKANWNFRQGANTLGWYNLRRCQLIEILFENGLAWRKRDDDGGSRLVVLAD